MMLWYLSFADDGWLGCAFVHGISIVDAAGAAHALGCNPGGEVLGGVVPTELQPPARWIGRLLTKADLRTIAREMGHDDTLARVDSDWNVLDDDDG